MTSKRILFFRAMVVEKELRLHKMQKLWDSTQHLNLATVMILAGWISFQVRILMTIVNLSIFMKLKKFWCLQLYKSGNSIDFIAFTPIWFHIGNHISWITAPDKAQKRLTLLSD
jgi:hypothetical protein